MTEHSDQQVDAQIDAEDVRHPERAPFPQAPVAPTGNAQIDEVVASLSGLDDRPLEEHVAVFEAAHEALRSALSDAGREPGRHPGHGAGGGPGRGPFPGPRPH